MLLRSFRHRPRLFNVDEERVLVESEPGTLAIVSASGALLSSLHLHVSGAVLRHDRLVTIKRRDLVLRDLRGNALRRLRVPPGSTLEDARGDLVVYQTPADQLHLLRLSDGRDVALRLAGQGLTGQPASGRLDPTGLFYAYTRLTANDEDSGTIGFVAAGELRKLLAR
jgi:hypothetical protein